MDRELRLDDRLGEPDKTLPYRFGDFFCEKGHTDYDIYRATKDTVNVI